MPSILIRKPFLCETKKIKFLLEEEVQRGHENKHQKPPATIESFPYNITYISNYTLKYVARKKPYYKTKIYLVKFEVKCVWKGS